MVCNLNFWRQNSHTYLVLDLVPFPQVTEQGPNSDHSLQIPSIGQGLILHGSTSLAQCLKITEKVALNIASEASYISKSSLEMPKNSQFWLVLENLKLENLKCDILDDFQTMCLRLKLVTR